MLEGSFTGVYPVHWLLFKSKACSQRSPDLQCQREGLRTLFAVNTCWPALWGRMPQSPSLTTPMPLFRWIQVVQLSACHTQSCINPSQKIMLSWLWGSQTVLVDISDWHRNQAWKLHPPSHIGLEKESISWAHKISWSNSFVASQDWHDLINF